MIPKRYKKMGITQVGKKYVSSRPEKKWMVLAKKGDKYKVVHGGYEGMEDYTQHKDKKRRKRFWDRMGGYNSTKASDKFSPLYWHKKFSTWERGGLLEDDTIKVVWFENEESDLIKSKMFNNIDDAKSYAKSQNNYLIMELESQDKKNYKWRLLPYGDYEDYKAALELQKWTYTIGGL